MKARRSSPLDPPGDEELAVRFYDLLASCNDEELLEVFQQ